MSDHKDCEARIRALTEGLARIEASCASRPRKVRAASGEVLTYYDMDGGTMRELLALLGGERSQEKK